MNAQEAFNIAATHLLNQNQQARKPGNVACSYRAEVDGKVLKCAVGALIPDEVYKPEMENKNILGLTLNFPEVCEPLKDVPKALLRDLQYLHDTSQPRYWRQGLRDVALRYSLNDDAARDKDFE